MTVEAVVMRIQALLQDLHDVDIPLEMLPTMGWHETGLESLALMELVLHLEQEYACSVSNEALRDVHTFGDLATQVVAAVEVRA